MRKSITFFSILLYKQSKRWANFILQYITGLTPSSLSMCCGVLYNVMLFCMVLLKNLEGSKKAKSLFCDSNTLTQTLKSNIVDITAAPALKVFR